MRFGYLRADKLSDIKAFESKAKADVVFCDMKSSSGYSINVELKELLNKMQVGDTLVIKNLNDLLRGIQDNKFLGPEDLNLVLQTCIQKSIHLVSLEDDEEKINLLLRLGVHDALIFINDFYSLKVTEYMNSRIKPGKHEINYPPRFYSNYRKYEEGLRNRKDPNRLTGDKAAENLGITRRAFLKFRRDFER